METLVTVLKIFPFNPIAALLLAGIFAAGAFNKKYTAGRRTTLTIAAALWGLYAPYELYMLTWRSSTGDMAIRVDLVFLVPLLLVVALFGVVALMGGRKG